MNDTHFLLLCFFFFQAEDGIRDLTVTGVQTCALPIFWENHPMWAKIDDALRPFRTAPRGARMIGYAGPPTAKASEALTKYIITDMYAKAVQGLSAEDAVKWAEGELKKIYED